MEITQGNAGIDGNINAGLNLGLAAEASYTSEFEKNIATAGFPAFSIPNVIVVGPEVALDVTLGFNITASGQVLAGASMSIPSFSANLDLVDSSQSYATGFTPQFGTQFSVSGEIKAAASLGLPLTIGIGLDLVPLNIRKLISVTNEPSLDASASYSYSSDGGGDCNNGVEYSIALADDTRLDFFGLKEIDLFNYKPPDLVSGCKLLGSAPSTSLDVPSMLLAHRKRQDNPTTDIPGGDEPNDDNPSNYNATDSTYSDMLANADAEEDADTSNSTALNTDGFVYSTIPDLSGQYLLLATPNGSFHLASASDSAATDPGLTFASYDNVTVSDDADRILHYYPDLMAAFGVSRFRISGSDAIPKTAEIITLVPFNYDDDDATPGVLMAADTAGNVFYTVACNIRGQVSKLFLANNPDEGVKTLEREDLQFIVTGGVVSNCTYVPLAGSGPGLS